MASPRRILRDVIVDGRTPRKRGDGSGRSYAAEDANRTKVLLQARVRPEVKERAEALAGSHAISVSDLIAALVNGTEIKSSRPDAVADGLLYAVAGNHVLRALGTLQARLDAGQDPALLSPLLDELKAVRRAIVEGELAARPAYEAEMDARRKAGASDDWSGDE